MPRASVTQIVAGFLALAAASCGDDATPLPCDVDAVLEAECRRCHNAKLEFGAPMPLSSWEDTQATAVTDDSVLVWELMQDRVHGVGGLMPPPGVGSLSAAQLATLDAWFAAGAPAGDGECP
jgi:hypothetical protein